MKTIKRRLESARFSVLMPGGDILETELPVAFSGRDLAERLAHAEIFAEVPSRRILIGAIVDGRPGRLEGPAAAWWSREANGWIAVPRIPRSEPEAVQILAEATESVRR